MLFPTSKTPNWVIFLIDIILSTISLILAYCIRFEFHIKAIEMHFFNNSLISVLIFINIKFLVFIVFKIYQGHIRHTSILMLKDYYLL